MSKYQPLAIHLHQSGRNSIAMTFAEVERIIGTNLPPSAFKYRAWWSNNPMNSVITRAWLDAGYKTANVDMSKHRLIFKKVPLAKSAEELSGKRLPLSNDRTAETASAHSFSFSRISGALKGTVTIMPGVDLTLPTGEAWEAQK